MGDLNLIKTPKGDLLAIGKATNAKSFSVNGFQIPIGYSPEEIKRRIDETQKKLELSLLFVKYKYEKRVRKAKRKMRRRKQLYG